MQVHKIVFALFLWKVYALPAIILDDVQVRFKYNVTVSPANGIDDDTCYPSGENGMSNVPCQSLNFALKIDQRNYILFYLADPNQTYYLDTEKVTFVNGNYVGFFGANTSYPHQAKIHCGGNASLSFVNFNNVVFRMVQFVHCGAWHNSTSIDMTKKPQQLLKIRAALYFYNCTDVSMSHVQVTHSFQSMAVVMYNVDGIVDISGCNFSSNIVNESSFGGGGFAVEFTYCNPGDDTCNNTNYDAREPRRNKDALYTFTNCSFKNNKAHAQSHSVYGGYALLSSNSSHQAVGRGGGLSVFFKGDAFNNSMVFINCTFVGNSAVDGAGLFLKMSDSAIANSVSVLGCHFLKNQAYFQKEFGTGGGGLSFSTRIFPWNNIESRNSNVMQNQVFIHRCNFMDNHALSGGGVLFSISLQLLQPIKVEVSQSSFEFNKAEVGSALANILFTIFNNGDLPQVKVSNCRFIRNSMSYANDTIHFVGIGTVYVRHLPTIFQGHNKFARNEGSALSVIGTQVNFVASTVDFIENRGLVGAGIALLGSASILVGENSVMNFINNHAKQYGGAIYNRDNGRDPETFECFIRYSKPFLNPTQWNVSFAFINNTAEILGSAIFSTDILQCSHGFSEVQKIFCWDQWDYGHSDCTDQIYTKAHTFNTTTTAANPVKIYPGHPVLLPLESLDNLGHNVTLDTVYFAYVFEGNRSIAEVEPGYTHVASNYIGITGKPKQNLTLVMQTDSFPILQVKMNIEIHTCPPGFILDDSDVIFSVVNNKQFCRCPKENAQSYRGLLKCFQEDFQSWIPARMWIGAMEVQQNSSVILMGRIPMEYSKTENASYKNVSIDFEQLDNGICGPVNRTGPLCGKCLPGYAVAVNSDKFECIPCNITSSAEFARHLFAYIGLSYGPVLVLLLVVIFFRFKLASSATMGFILYAQMIGSGIFSLYSALCDDCPAGKLQTAYETVYGLFNLKSLAFLMSPFCLNEHFSTLDVICLEYAIAGFPLVMIILISLAFRCTSRFRCQCVGSSVTKGKYVCNAPQNTLLHAFISFVLLSYTKFSLASTRTIVVSDLFDQTGVTKQKRIFYAGHLTLLHFDFLFPYGLIAYIILFFIVIFPPLLLVGPLLIDWVMEKQGFSCLHRVWPSIKVHTYLDTCHGYYKSDRRWFSCTYFIFRIIIFFCYSFSMTEIQAYVIQQIAVSILIVLVALFRPYKKEYYNNIDILLFLNLAVLNALGIYISVNIDVYFSYKVYIIECILVWLPLIYIIFYAMWSCLKRIKAHHKVKNFIKMSPVVNSAFESTVNERERLLKNEDKADTSDNSDEDDEYLYMRAAEGNVYQYGAKKEPSTTPGKVTHSVVNVPHAPPQQTEMGQSETGDFSGIVKTNSTE